MKKHFNSSLTALLLAAALIMTGLPFRAFAAGEQVSTEPEPGFTAESSGGATTEDGIAQEVPGKQPTEDPQKGPAVEENLGVQAVMPPEQPDSAAAEEVPDKKMQMEGPQSQAMPEAEPVMMQTLAASVGVCGQCGQEAAYTVAYEYSTEDYHAVRHWCSSCGEDQCGGTYFARHTFENGVCTLCGYSRPVPPPPPCAHSRTHIVKNGCHWEKFCDDCGKLIESGADHGPCSYGSWQYYTPIQHRRSFTCDLCGETGWEYADHNHAYTYENCDDHHHKKTMACKDCNTATGAVLVEEHAVEFGKWRSKNKFQHQRDGYCACGYYAVEQADHNFDFRHYAKLNSEQHQTWGNCIECGQFQRKNEPHMDLDGDGYCDGCGYMMARISVVVPTTMQFTVSEKGEVFVPTAAEIINNSSVGVKITELWAYACNGWTLLPYQTNMAGQPVNSNGIGIRVNGAETQYTGTAESMNGCGWVIQKGLSMPLDCDAVVTAFSEPISTQPMQLVFVVGLAR